MLLVTRGMGEPVGGTAFTLTSLAPSASLITATFNDAPLISGAAIVLSNWIIQGGPVQVTVTGLTIVGNTILIATTEQKTGVVYTLALPTLGIRSVGNQPFDGPFEPTFTGVGVQPTVLIGQSIDARTLQVSFSEPVVESEAETGANYSVDNGLTVSTGVKVSDTVFRLTTSKQTVGQLYTVTVSNIHDLSGNLI